MESHSYKLPSLELLQLNSEQLSHHRGSKGSKSTQKSTKNVGNRIRWGPKDQRAHIRIKMQSEKGKRVCLAREER